MYNKILLSLALAMTTPFAGTFIAAQTTSSEQAPYVYDIADGEADIYGYLRFDTRLRTQPLEEGFLKRGTSCLNYT